MYRKDFWNLWQKARVGCFKRTASKHVYYLGWNRSPAQVGYMRQALGPGALGRPRGIGWRRRWEGGSGWGTHVNPWLIHFNVWQNPLQYCKVISLQLIKNKERKKSSGDFGRVFLLEKPKDIQVVDNHYRYSSIRFNSVEMQWNQIVKGELPNTHTHTHRTEEGCGG